jgi:hypothetical protein
LNGLARHRINTRLIAEHWDEICRLTASLRAGTVVPSAILRTLQRGPSPTSLARALAELGRVIKPCTCSNTPTTRPIAGSSTTCSAAGNAATSLARDVFHGQRGQLRRHYQVGQENQLDSLGIMINVIVLWQTVYTQAALDHLAASGYPLDPADVARLTPLGHPTINLAGRYRTTSRPPATGLRPLRIDSGSCTDPRHRPAPPYQPSTGEITPRPKGPDQLPRGISDCEFSCFIAMARETDCPQFGALRLPAVLDQESQPVPACPQRSGTSLNVTQLSLDHLQLDGGIVNELLGFHVTSHGTALTLR